MRYARQFLVVADGHPLAAFDLLGEDAKFFQQNRRLQCVEASVKADSCVVVLVGSLAVYPQALQDTDEIVIICKHGTAIAITTERFCWKEARGRRRPDRADLAAFV